MISRTRARVNRVAFCLLFLGLMGMPAWAEKGEGKDPVAPIPAATSPSGVRTSNEGPGSIEECKCKSRLGSIDPTNVAVGWGEFSAMPTSIAPDETPRLRLTEAQQLARGNGVRIAVLDSGFNLAHPALLQGRRGPAYDAVDGDDDPTDLGDGLDGDGDGRTDLGVGHGTFVASLILRCAPSAILVPVRIADDEGWGNDFALADGMRFALSTGVQVINLSFHVDGQSKLVEEQLERAEQMGVLVVCAAGNEGIEADGFLSRAKTTLTTGAVDSRDRRAWFSNYGSEVRIYAPGVDVLAAYGAPTDAALARWSGTSFATAFVSAAAALVIERRGISSAATLRARLIAAVEPVMPFDRERVTGGRISFLRAAQGR